ncbi:hypothetical protein GPECTOR_12g492 [Gonium pectorale]|uniref:Uncharacterized protein n=1 Tax=Gonium pectorale TaxID=33097 RepID=A0A150GNW7_GONPE|nr:hypothetical protein GPECTOR_12g492 [Gonium pectorale]|eukprot:KXZ51529.1 hypothetical protein GPECTOR_12g492 [Gonium pectorale]
MTTTSCLVARVYGPQGNFGEFVANATSGNPDRVWILRPGAEVSTPEQRAEWRRRLEQLAVVFPVDFSKPRKKAESLARITAEFPSWLSELGWVPAGVLGVKKQVVLEVVKIVEADPQRLYQTSFAATLARMFDATVNGRRIYVKLFDGMRHSLCPMPVIAASRPRREWGRVYSSNCIEYDLPSIRHMLEAIGYEADENDMLVLTRRPSLLPSDLEDLLGRINLRLEWALAIGRCKVTADAEADAAEAGPSGSNSGRAARSRKPPRRLHDEMDAAVPDEEEEQDEPDEEEIDFMQQACINAVPVAGPITEQRKLAQCLQRTETLHCHLSSEAVTRVGSMKPTKLFKFQAKIVENLGLFLWKGREGC